MAQFSEKCVGAGGKGILLAFGRFLGWMRDRGGSARYGVLWLKSAASSAVPDGTLTREDAKPHRAARGPSGATTGTPATHESDGGRPGNNRKEPEMSKYAQNVTDALARAEARLAAPRMSEAEFAERLAAKAAGNEVAAVEAEELAKAREANRKSAGKWAEVRAEETAQAHEETGAARLFRVDLPQDDAALELVTNEDVEKASTACRKAYPAARGVRIEVVDFGEGNEVVWAPIIDAPRFERIRRITGYLVGTLDRFNNGKRSEEAQRVKHGVGCSCCG